MKLTMMRGLPASGKTTAARLKVKKEGNHGRINRDDLRAMLFDSAWSGKREQVVIDVEKAIADVLVRHKLNPIVDDTNLTQKHEDMWKQAAKDNQVMFEVEDLRGVSLAECLGRDTQRTHPVGRPVIELMAAKAGLIDWGEKQIVLVDLDGTVADLTHRQHFLDETPKNWEGFFANVYKDKPIEFVIKMVRALQPTHAIAIVSGRPDSTWVDTQEWLWKYGVLYDHIFMRASSDKRPDVLVKQQILDALPKEKIAWVLDDRPSVQRMWKMNGLRVIPVRGGLEEF